MRKKAFVFLALMTALAATPAYAFEAKIDAEADAVFKQMCAAVASLKTLAVDEDITEDKVFPNGQKLAFNKTAKIAIAKPGKLRSVTTGDAGGETVVVIDGPKFGLYKSSDNVYGELDVPPTLDASLDYILAKLSVNAPTSDLFKDDPYAAIMPGILEATYVGDAKIGGKPCRHLAFRQLEVDWQIWVAYGDRPLPVRVVITDKTLHGNPEYRVDFKNWKANPQLPGNTFSYAPPKDAQKIDLIVTDDKAAD